MSQGALLRIRYKRPGQRTAAALGQSTADATSIVSRRFPNGFARNEGGQGAY